MNREQLKSKILREVVILYFDHLMTNQDMLNAQLYDTFFHKWHTKLLKEDLDKLSIEDLEALENDLDLIYNVYYPSPSSAQSLSIEHLNHSLEKFKALQQCASI